MSDQKRQYTMKRRAELEEETRRRIAASTAELHERVGPARTTVSAVAERAGVRRSTVYRHFPDDAALLRACSAHWLESNPRPDVARWRALENPDERLRVALDEMYDYYRRTQAMWTSLLRDESLVPAVSRQLHLGFYPFLEQITRLLMAGRRLRGHAARRTRAAIAHAVAFPTWHSLTAAGLTDEEAVQLMTELVGRAQD
jgi:AcrR family transcriptional regulator